MVRKAVKPRKDPRLLRIERELMLSELFEQRKDFKKFVRVLRKYKRKGTISTTAFFQGLDYALRAKKGIGPKKLMREMKLR